MKRAFNLTFKTAETEKDYKIVFWILILSFFVLSFFFSALVTIAYIVFEVVGPVIGFTYVWWLTFLLSTLISNQLTQNRYMSFKDAEKRKTMAKAGYWFKEKGFFENLEKKIEMQEPALSQKEFDRIVDEVEKKLKEKVQL